MSFHRSIDEDNDCSRFFFSLNVCYIYFNSDPVSVCVLLYGIILIQILIKYNVKNLITACTRLHDSEPPKLKNLPTVGGGTPPSHTTPPPPPPFSRFAPSGLVAPLPRICSQNIFCVFLEVRNPPPPPTHTHF